MDHFWQGFEKQASEKQAFLGGLAHGAGRLLGAGRRAGAAIKGAPGAARSKASVIKTRMREDFRRGAAGKPSLKAQAATIKARGPKTRAAAAARKAPPGAGAAQEKRRIMMPKSMRAPVAAGMIGGGMGYMAGSGGNSQQQQYGY